MLKYTADCGNIWFRELYKHGIFIPSHIGAGVAPMAWGLTDAGTKIVLKFK